MLCAVFKICFALSGVPDIHDGDTIYINRQAIRLHGVDAEELFEPHGLDAKRALTRLVNSGLVTCVPTGATSHSRIVARCYLKDNRELNRTMIAEGAALDCARYSGGEYRKDEPPGARARLLQKPYC